MTDREALKLMLGRAGVKFEETQRIHKSAGGLESVFAYEIRVPAREAHGAEAAFTFNQWGDLQQFQLRGALSPGSGTDSGKEGAS